MRIDVQPDLEVAIADMLALNGDLTEDGYVNNLIEMGLRRDLETAHTPESVQAFMDRLRRTRRADWGLLVVAAPDAPAPTAGRQ